MVGGINQSAANLVITQGTFNSTGGYSSIADDDDDNNKKNLEEQQNESALVPATVTVIVEDALVNKS